MDPSQQSQPEAGANLVPSSVRSAQFSGMLLTVEPDKLSNLFLAREFGTLSRYYCEVLTVLEKARVGSFDSGQLEFVNAFLKVFLDQFSSEEFGITDDYAGKFLSHNEAIANLTYVSDFVTTDPWLRMVLRQQRNLVKVLTLFSARNGVPLDVSALFDVDASIASKWITLAIGGCFSFGESETERNYLRLLEQIDERFQPFSLSNAMGYLTCSYAGEDNDAAFKQRFNASLRRSMQVAKPVSRPDPESLAVVSGLWFPDHVIYRNNLDLIEWLRQRYRLTLVYVEFDFSWQKGRDLDSMDLSPFHDVRKVGFGPSGIECGEVLDNDFAAAYYTDIGMVPPTIFLSNMRLAPVQITGYGHPVSTFGSEIDYFIGGADVESADAQRHYTEKLVLVPGLGVNSAHARVLRENRGGTSARVVARPVTVTPATELRIACCWGQHKLNHRMLALLRTIAERAPLPVRYQVLTAAKPLSASYQATEQELLRALEGVPVEMQMLEFGDYIAAIESSAFALDAYPFGGFNTIADVLSCGKAVVVWQGQRAFNRLASAFMRRIGLYDLIAYDEAEYLALALRLMTEPELRAALEERIAAIDVLGEFERACRAEDIGRAISHVIDHHESLQASPGPVVIE